MLEQLRPKEGEKIGWEGVVFALILLSPVIGPVAMFAIARAEQFLNVIR